MMKYKYIVVFSIVINFVLSFLATIWAAKGTFHYFPFLLSPVIIYDGIKSYQTEISNTKQYVHLLQIAVGIFIVAEHAYLIQAFWRGQVNF